MPEETTASSAAPGLGLAHLSQALHASGVPEEQHAQLEAMLATHAQNSAHGPVIERTRFIDALERGLDEIPLASDDSDDSDAASAYDPTSDSDDAQPKRKVRKSARTYATMPKSKALRTQARLLYQLLLEQIPMVHPSALSSHVKSARARTDVDDHEIDTRRIGMDELRYAAQALGETPSSAEVRPLPNAACGDAIGSKHLLCRYAFGRLGIVATPTDRFGRVRRRTHPGSPT